MDEIVKIIKDIQDRLRTLEIGLKTVFKLGASIFVMNEVASNSETPESGKLHLYAKIDDKLYYKTDDGVEHAVGSDISAIANAIYPVGAIYMSVVNTSPATLFGGTWSAWGTGRVPVGIDTGQTEFDTIEETGGAKTHKHKGYGDADSGETAGDLRATVGSPSGDASRLGFIALDATNPNTGSAVGDATYRVGGSNLGSGPFSHYTKVVGYTSTKNNLPPYITCYMWKRTA